MQPKSRRPAARTLPSEPRRGRKAPWEQHLRKSMSHAKPVAAYTMMNTSVLQVRSALQEPGHAPVSRRNAEHSDATAENKKGG